jgi:drug/metabolite transporter (DMT)-like permease
MYRGDLYPLFGSPFHIFEYLGFGESISTPTGLLWGALAGVFGMAGLAALYLGLARGRMAVVAPVTAAIAAALPVLVGLLLEGWPSPWQLAGFVVALAAVWLLAQDGDGVDALIDIRELRLPFIAGIGFGLFFIFIDQASHDGVFWPLLAARLSSIGILTVLVLTRREWKIPPRTQFPLLVLIGVFETGGNAFFALATQIGRLDISAVLASLYPATTVLLAALVLKEKVGRPQKVGIVATLAALILIAL